MTVSVVSVHKHVRTLKLNEYRAHPIQLNRIFFLLLSLQALNWAFRPCTQHLSRLFPGSPSPGNCLFEVNCFFHPSLPRQIGNPAF